MQHGQAAVCWSLVVMTPPPILPIAQLIEKSSRNTGKHTKLTSLKNKGKMILLSGVSAPRLKPGPESGFVVSHKETEALDTVDRCSVL